jgi:hypothetical protein
MGCKPDRQGIVGLHHQIKHRVAFEIFKISADQHKENSEGQIGQGVHGNIPQGKGDDWVTIYRSSHGESSSDLLFHSIFIIKE